MATIKQTEATPATYPASPPGLTAGGAAVSVELIWHRIESYVVHRWTPRAVVWTVEGAGEWVPPLAPATITTAEVWAGEEWHEVFPAPSPLGGYMLVTDGPYRFTGTVGGGTLPAAVSEAFRRLAEYMAEAGEYSMWKGRPGAASVRVDLGGVSQSFDRSPAWVARAIQNSGAADLLRPYREVL